MDKTRADYFAVGVQRKIPVAASPVTPARGVERHLMGAAHRCAVDGLARPIPAAPDLPPKIPAMDKAWGV